MDHEQALSEAGIGATDIDHVGIAVRDLEAAVEHYRMVFGSDPVHREEIESDGVREALFAVGSSFVQLLAPTGPDTPVGRFLERRGEGVHHVGYRVPNVAAAVAHLRGHGVVLADQHPGPARAGPRWRSPIRRASPRPGRAGPGGGRDVTYSIVARDPGTGELGVAVQTRWFNVGSVVPWAEPGVGAVATQSFAEISYGPKGIELMGQGVPAADALDRLRAEDPAEAARQVAMVDANGTVAVFTGSGCVAEAGSASGDGVTTQANMMERATVWGAMLAAFESAARVTWPIACSRRCGRPRTRAVTCAAASPLRCWWFRRRATGGRGGSTFASKTTAIRSASWPACSSWHVRSSTSGADFDLAGRMAFPAALDEMDSAAALAPDDDEIAFFRAMMLAPNGRPMEAREELDRIRLIEPRWGPYLWRSAKAGLAPNDPDFL